VCAHDGYQPVFNNTVNVPIYNNVTFHLSQVYQVISAYIQVAAETTSTYTHETLQAVDTGCRWVRNHPIWSTCIGLATTHITLNCYASWLSYRLDQPTCWNTWKYHLTNQEIEQIPMHTLKRDLIYEIHRRYTNPQNPSDFAQPLQQFIAQLEYEHTMLQRYQWICQILEWTYASRCSWFNERLYEQADARLRRLDKIWHIFISWLSEHQSVDDVRNLLVKSGI